MTLASVKARPGLELAFLISHGLLTEEPGPLAAAQADVPSGIFDPLGLA